MNANDIKTLFTALAERFEQEKDHLGELDTVLGDGDHGVSMARGFSQANDAIQDGDADDVGLLFQHAGRALMRGIGGASGPLFGMVLLELGKANLGHAELTTTGLSIGIMNASLAVQKLGKAEQGDKTMLDVLLPVSEVLQAESDLGIGLENAASTAKDAAAKTTEMPAKKGRAQYVQNAGLGHPDPGATSLAIFFDVFNKVYTETINIQP